MRLAVYIEKLHVKKPTYRKGGESVMDTEVRVKKGEIIDRALRRLKKKLDKEGTLKELRNRRHYEKPSEVKRREAKQRRR